MRKLILLLIVILLGSFVFTADVDGGLQLTPTDYRFIQEHPVIRIGPDPEFIPFEFRDKQGVYRGIAADILDIIEQRTGLKFVLTGNLTWQEVTSKALDREIDLLPAVGKTIERDKVFLFSRPYITFQRVAVVKNTNQSIDAFSDLFGRQVSVQANSSHHGLLQKYPQIDIRTYNTVEEALKAVNRGEEVAFVGNEATASYIARANGMSELSFIPIDTGEILQLHMAVRSDWPQLVSILDKALDSISESEFTQIYQKWITIDHRIDYTPFIIIAAALALLSLIVFGVSAFWITRLKREIAKEEAAMERAETADREKSRFMARMSHEIRTPLNGINGMAYLLQGTALDSTQKRYLATISQAAKNMLSIINDIIEYSRIEERRIPIEKIPFKLDEIVQHVLSMEHSLIHQKNLRLQFEWGADVPIHVVGDGNRVGEIITNLLHNAIKFTKKGTIGIRTYCTQLESSSCRVMFEISDTGIGISDETQANLFKPFSQADDSISRKYGGSGLGLSIVKSLVELMDGTLSLTSELGKGSLFSFELPFELDGDGEQEDSRRLAAIDFSSLNVLVLARDEETRKAIEIALRRIGASGDYIGSELLASQLVVSGTSSEASRYRLLIIDATVGGGVGRLLTTLQDDFSTETRPKTVVFVSTENDSSAEEMRQLGGNIVLPKPVLPSLVFNSILDLFTDTLLSKQYGEESNSVASGELLGTILVVEDNAVNRIIAKEVLERAGYRVLMAENGVQGYELYGQKREQIDLILMDLHMDVMDGFEATRRIRGMDAQVPIFATTADVIGDINERCRAAGFSRIVSKPYDPEELPVIIGQNIGQHISQNVEVVPKKQPLYKSAGPHAKKESDIFNTVRGLKRVDNDTVLFNKIVGLFIEELEEDLLNLEQAFAEKDWESVANLAHKTKGGALTIGAERLGDAAKHLQLKAQEEAPVDTLLFEEFKAEITRLDGKIREFLATSTPNG